MKTRILLTIVFSVLAGGFGRAEAAELQLEIAYSSISSTPHQGFFSHDSAESEINRIAGEVGACLTQAFQAGGSSELFTVNIAAVRQLTPTEEATLSESPEKPSTFPNGEIIRGALGRDTKRFVVTLSDRYKITHVPWYFSDKLLAFLSADGLERIKRMEAEWASAGAEPVRQQTIERAYHQLTEGLFFPSNRINMSFSQFIGSSRQTDFKHRTSTIIAHELMHAWGGLEDEYVREKSNNLMTDFVCILRHDQVLSVLKHRTRL